MISMNHKMFFISFIDCVIVRIAVQLKNTVLPIIHTKTPSLQLVVQATTTVLLQSSGTCIQSQDEGENHQHQQQRTGKCKYTWDALTKLGLIKQNIDNGTGQWVYCDTISNREYISF
mmetsp:Transcript_9492/g.13473  ORF Transcript_9492/g.13473 Transcript_9492/m.13473 type:complete len:117 (+) Transcript_9492:447-797(+)